MCRYDHWTLKLNICKKSSCNRIFIHNYEILNYDAMNSRKVGYTRVC